jgi:predicted SAM-dependent methyltransferase
MATAVLEKNLTKQAKTETKTFLHVGCGQKFKNRTTTGFNSDLWREVRLDIVESVKPDIVSNMLDMKAVESGTMDGLFSSHNIEHLYPHEVVKALSEFRRVLKPDGFAIITCPDLQSVCELVAEDKLIEAAYESPAGPVAPIDIIYGHRKSLEEGHLYMAHKTGFTKKSLAKSLAQAGFNSFAITSRKSPCFDLWACATVQKMPNENILLIARQHFPVRGKSIN